MVSGRKCWRKRLTLTTKHMSKEREFHSLSFGAIVKYSLLSFLFKVKVCKSQWSRLTGSSPIAIVRNEFTSTHVQSGSITTMPIRLAKTNSLASDKTAEPTVLDSVNFSI